MGSPDKSGANLIPGIGAAAVAVTVWGLAGVLVKGIDMGGIAIGAYRFGVYGLAATVVFALRGRALSGAVLRASMWGGLALGADVAFFFSAVKETSIANATVIGALQPVVVAIVGWRMFGETIRRLDLVLAAVAVVAVSVVVFGGTDTAVSTPLGDLLAVGALFSWSAYFVASKHAKAQVSATEFTTGAAIWAGAVNLVLAPLFGQSLAWPDPPSWLGILALAFIGGLFGHALMNWSIQQIPLWISSTLTLLIPVVSSGVGWAVFGESLTGVQLVAMGVVVGALGAIVANQSGVGSWPRPLRR